MQVSIYTAIGGYIVKNYETPNEHCCPKWEDVLKALETIRKGEMVDPEYKKGGNHVRAS